SCSPRCATLPVDLMPFAAQRHPQLASPVVVLVLAACGMLLLNGCRHGHGSSPNHPWTANPVLLRQLGPETAINGYRIRLPKGFQSKRDLPGFAGSHAYILLGPKRADGTSSMLMLVILRDPDKLKGVATPEQALEKFLSVQ